jgi:hypothetical protein
MADTQQNTGRVQNLTNAGKGRKKGVPNKTTLLAKEAIAKAAEGLGGTDRLIAWVKEDEANERVFWSQIYTKLIPVQTELTGKDGGPIEIDQVRDDADAFTRTITGLVARAGAGSGAEQTQH